MIYPKLPAKFLGVTCFETDPWALPIGVSEDQGYGPLKHIEKSSSLVLQKKSLSSMFFHSDFYLPNNET